jgi:integrase
MASAYKATGINNLDFHVETKTYYARLKQNGNTIRHAVGKNRETARKLKNDWLEEMRGKNSGVDGTLGGLVEKYYQWLDEELALQHMSERNKEYKVSCLKEVRDAWRDFDLKRISALHKPDMRACKAALMARYSNTRVNGGITVVRELFELAVDGNMITRSDRDTLTEDFVYASQTRDYSLELAHIPEPAMVVQLRDMVHKRCKNRGTKGADLFDFLLFSGCRIESAREVRWEDVRWSKGELYFRKAKRNRTYTIPLFPELRELLEQLKSESGGTPDPKAKVLSNRSIQTVMRGACDALGIPRLSHHDLRHLFATRAIEAKVDLVVLAGWLGHKDAKMVLAVYGHLRKTHSHELAAKMQFLPAKKAESGFSPPADMPIEEDENSPESPKKT